MRIPSLFLVGMFVCLPLAPIFAQTTCPSYPNTLTNGTTADANAVMGNFNSILNCANNSLTPSSGGTLTNPALSNPTVSGGTLNTPTLTNPTLNGTSAVQRLQFPDGSTQTSASGGARLLLATLTASNSASLSDTTHFTSTYSEYEIVFENILPATTSVNLYMQFYSGGTLQTAATYNSSILIPSSYMIVNNATQFSLLYGARLTASTSTTNAGFTGTMRLSNPLSTSLYKNITLQGGFYSAALNGIETTVTSGSWNNAAAISGVLFNLSSGNLSSGMIKIYGWN